MRAISFSPYSVREYGPSLYNSAHDGCHSLDHSKSLWILGRQADSLLEQESNPLHVREETRHPEFFKVKYAKFVFVLRTLAGTTGS